ncbi:uncharacterized protein LOC132726152 [Ruditapes philippinarum]|uniref:uncharacterized protein LOC132726152 n=1 Tax=Ruditapes philippinarum TaxID=129788 RepID=UPI00295BDAE7|nr:uncharacterized protein LOC132726152 [Ruditapes philippinarum]
MLVFYLIYGLVFYSSGFYSAYQEEFSYSVNNISLNTNKLYFGTSCRVSCLYFGTNMASKELEKKKILPSRGKRVDYKLLNDGFGDEDQESFWTEEHMEDIKLFSEETTQATLLPTSASAKNVSFHEDDEFSGDTDLNSKSRQTDSGIIQMKKELSALQQEERVLKEQLSEADVLRKQIEQKKQDVKKLREHVAHPPLRKCTIVSDSIAKNVSGIWDTQITAFPGINISRLSFRISQGQVDLRSAYVILHVGTNDVTGPRSEDEIISSFNDLISNVRQQSSGSIIVSAIIPRPIDFDTTGNRVKNLNNKLVLLCKSRNVIFIRTFKPFLKCGLPRREYYAIKDGGLHLNLEGTRRLKEFFINTIAHLK